MAAQHGAGARARAAERAAEPRRATRRTTRPNSLIRIGAGDRALIVGPTGFGKSTLATRIASSWDRVLVYDPKLDPSAELPNAAIRYGVRDALRAIPGRVIYRPLPSEMRDLGGAFDRLCRAVLDAGGAHGIVIHETADVAPSSGSPPYLSTAIRQGRRFRIPILFLTQRPAWIDRLALSESSHVFLFGLRDSDDRKVISRLTGLPERAFVPPAVRFSFIYVGPDGAPRVVAPVQAIGERTADATREQI